MRSKFESWPIAVTSAIATALASCVLIPLAQSLRWVWPSLALLTATTGVGLALRSTRLPGLLAIPVQFAAALTLLVGFFARENAYFGLVPSPAAVADLVKLAQGGSQTLSQFAAPVPNTAGVSLIFCLVIFTIGSIMDMLCVTFRSPTVAGIPLLILYCIPSAVLTKGLPATYFIVGAFGWLALIALGTADHIHSWGQNLPSRGRKSNAWGIRIGLAAICLAVILPAALPNIGDGRFFPGKSGDSWRPGNRSSINPILRLKEDLRPRRDLEVMRYKTTNPNPAPLRTHVVENYDGDIWFPKSEKDSAMPESASGMPAPAGLAEDVPSNSYTLDAKMADILDQPELPVPYPAQKVTGSTNWIYDPGTLSVRSRGPNALRQNFSAKYLTITPNAENIARTDRAVKGSLPRDQLSLPGLLPEEVRAAAVKQTRSAKTPYAKALALQSWFREGGKFRYSTEAPADTSNYAVADFLRSRSGYCLQFASTMAVMARTLGIPSRMAVGFLPGKQLTKDEYSVRLTDAHAWPELYFYGLGWVRFEPTPSSRTGAATSPSSAPSSSAAASASPSSTRSGNTPTPSRTAAAKPSPSASSSQEDNPQGNPWLARVSWMLLPGLLLVGLLAVGRLLAFWSLRGAYRQPANLAARIVWRYFLDRLGDYGIRENSSHTPRKVASQLLAQKMIPDSLVAELWRFIDAIEQASYARPQLTADSLADRSESIRLATAARQLIRRITRSLSYAARLRGQFRRVSGWQQLAGRRG